MGWKETLAAVAPSLATALGGPLAGMAVQMATSALGIEPNEEALQKELLKGNPDALLKLKQVENDFIIKLEELGIERERIAGEDRASARAREMQLRDNTPRNLAYSYSIMFLLVLIAQFAIIILEVTIAPGATRLLDTTMGILFAMLLGTKEYFFGSSAGSKMKTEQMKEMFKKK